MFKKKKGSRAGKIAGDAAPGFFFFGGWIAVKRLKNRENNVTLASSFLPAQYVRRVQYDIFF